MTDLAYQESLKQAGLNRDQAAVYEALVKMGPSPASDIALSAGIGRPLAYKVLDGLISFGLVEENKEPKKVARFAPAHPLKLKEVVEKRLDQAKGAQTALEGVLGKLTSDFNLQSGKPGVRFFEGIDGIREVAWDTLTTKGELRMYADVEAIRKFIPELNAEYIKERTKRGIKKRTLVLDTDGSREYLRGGPPDLTDTRLIKTDESPFQTDMHIYDGKVSYITLSEEHLVGIIIADPHIYATHKYLFDFMWEKAESLQAASASRSSEVGGRSNAA